MGHKCDNNSLTIQLDDLFLNLLTWHTDGPIQPATPADMPGWYHEQ